MTGGAAGVAAGGAAGVVIVVVVGVAAGVESVVVFGLGLVTRCECFGALVARESPIEETTPLLVVCLVTLVSLPATPDEYEPEACFGRLD